MDRSLRDALASVEDRHWWFEGRRRIVAAVLESLDPGSDARVLEAGCGNGANLEMLAAFGLVSAFEPDAEDLERATRRGAARVRPGSLPDAVPFEGERFDVIAALDVLEHLDDDRAALSALAPRLADGGRLVVTVPALPRLWSAHDESNHHRRRYTRRSLLDALQETGFVVERITYFNTFLFLPVAIVRTAGRRFGLDTAGTGMPAEPLNRLLAGIFAAERRVVVRRSLPFGVSLLAVARLPKP